MHVLVHACANFNFLCGKFCLFLLIARNNCQKNSEILKSGNYTEKNASIPCILYVLHVVQVLHLP